MSSPPLPERFRPKRLSDFFGQERWVKEKGLIAQSMHTKRPMSILFWGPPGTGKTSLARIYLNSFDLPRVVIHPSRFQIPEVKKHIDEAESKPLFKPTLFWIDEIHRLTRPQQDLLLKAVEDGSVCLIAATTENPSFVLSNALLSRLTVVAFDPLSQEDMMRIIERVEQEIEGLSFSKEIKQLLASHAQGDARKLLSFLEPYTLPHNSKSYTQIEEATQLLSQCSGGIVASGEGRYLLISALHKAVRGSDVDASLYWLSRLIHAGEDRLYIARRLVRMALEDIGLADPEALAVALRAVDTYSMLGSPEGDLALFHTTAYLALSPKSAATYTAQKAAMKRAEETGHLMPPKHILNAPTRWMEAQGFGEGYIWDHEAEDAFSGQRYFPEGMEDEHFFTPVERGFERELCRRLHYFQRLKERRKESPSSSDTDSEL